MYLCIKRTSHVFNHANRLKKYNFLILILFINLNNIKFKGSLKINFSVGLCIFKIINKKKNSINLFKTRHQKTDISQIIILKLFKIIFKNIL